MTEASEGEALPPLPPDGAPVDQSEDLRRAIRPDYFSDGEISDGAFRSSKPLSMDVASRCSLEESRNRKPTWRLAVLPCKAFTDKGYQPVHAPIKDDPVDPDNPAHAEVRAKITRSHARALAGEARQRLYEPLS